MSSLTPVLRSSTSHSTASNNLPEKPNSNSKVTPLIKRFLEQPTPEGSESSAYSSNSFSPPKLQRTDACSNLETVITDKTTAAFQKAVPIPSSETPQRPLDSDDDGRFIYSWCLRGDPHPPSLAETNDLIQPIFINPCPDVVHVQEVMDRLIARTVVLNKAKGVVWIGWATEIIEKIEKICGSSENANATKVLLIKRIVFLDQAVQGTIQEKKTSVSSSRNENDPVISRINQENLRIVALFESLRALFTAKSKASQLTAIQNHVSDIKESLEKINEIIKEEQNTTKEKIDELNKLVIERLIKAFPFLQKCTIPAKPPITIFKYLLRLKTYLLDWEAINLEENLQLKEDTKCYLLTIWAAHLEALIQKEHYTAENAFRIMAPLLVLLLEGTIDKPYTNETYATMAGLPLKEFYRDKIRLLQLTAFDLTTNPAILKKASDAYSEMFPIA